jgi:hypothetical protein
MVFSSPQPLTAFDRANDTRTRYATEEVVRRSIALIERTPTTLGAMVKARDQPTKP